MGKIKCPYCFEEFESDKVLFRANTGFTQEELDREEFTSGDVGEHKRLFVKFSQRNPDEKLDRYWTSRGGTAGYSSADPRWNMPHIDPNDADRFWEMLDPDANGVGADDLVRDQDGFAIRVYDRYSDRATPVTRLCPHCHNPLPLPNYGKYPTIFISVVGITTCGKTVYLNQLLTRWSESAVFVLGAYFKLQTFIFMPIFGISSGLIPILSYNYGSGALRRVSASVRFGQQFTAVLSLSGALLLSLLASPLLRSAFRASPEALAMGAPALRIIALSFFFAGTSIIFCSAFQSLGRSRWSLLVALLRQILLLLPAAALLLALKPALVWAAFPLSELISCFAAALLYRRTIQKQLL